MKYKFNNAKKDNGKAFFIAALSLLAILIGGWYAILPTELSKCESGKNLQECGCPTDKEAISKRNIILIDSTDYIPTG